MPFFSQLSELRPWKRITASSGEVTVTSAGTLDLKPCGSSALTHGILLSDRKRKVRSTFFSLNHDPLRSSTANGCPPSCSRAARISSRDSEIGKNHLGY